MSAIDLLGTLDYATRISTKGGGAYLGYNQKGALHVDHGQAIAKFTKEQGSPSQKRSVGPMHSLASVKVSIVAQNMLARTSIRGFSTTYLASCLVSSPVDFGIRPPSLNILISLVTNEREHQSFRRLAADTCVTMGWRFPIAGRTCQSFVSDGDGSLRVPAATSTDLRSTANAN